MGDIYTDEKETFDGSGIFRKYKRTRTDGHPKFSRYRRKDDDTFHD